MVSLTEQAVFGDVTESELFDWFAGHVHSRLTVDIAEVLFRLGQRAAGFGLRLTDGSRVVVRVYSNPPDMGRLAATSACQRVLADSGYPCPELLDGPASTEGRTAIIESLLDDGESGNAHEPGIRSALAHSLAVQVEALRSVPTNELGVDPGTGVRYNCRWPTPRDGALDGTATPVQYRWLDHIAQEAADVLGPPGQPEVIGHGSWACQNVRFAQGEVTAAYDWDSIIVHREAVLAGLSAGTHTEGSKSGVSAPTPDEVAAFLGDYDEVQPVAFSTAEQATAAAAATWALAFDARRDIGPEADSHLREQGSPLRMLSRYRDDYLQLRW